MNIRIREDFSKWSKEKVAGFRKAMLRSVLMLEARVVEKAPVVVGNLRNSISSHVEGAGAKLRGLVTVASKYAKYVVEGTGIYGPQKKPIKPKNKKALAFMAGGNEVIVRSVRGSKPNPFPYEALGELEGRITEELAEYVE